jgi:hypothetical protein
MFAIGREYFEVRAKRVPDAAAHRPCRNFGWRGLTLAQRLFQHGDTGCVI